MAIFIVCIKLRLRAVMQVLLAGVGLYQYLICGTLIRL